jgi:RNA polymerase sigma-70 factor (subfamily 1)
VTSESSPTDEQLIDLARKGDARAFEALCGRYEDLLRARARQWIVGAVKRKVSILDVLQEAYTVAHDRLDDFEDRGQGAFGAWLAQIAEFKAREAVRHYRGAAKRDADREVSRGGRPDTAEIRGTGRTPSQVLSAREEFDRVRQAMKELPADYRQVLQLLQLDHLTLKEAAVLMGRSYQATKKLYGRAVAALAKEFDE